MSMANFLLSSLEDRMNMMVSEVMQYCKCHTLDITETGEGNKNLTILILKEISNGEIKSTWFTKDEASRAVHIYEYLHDCSNNEFNDNNIREAKDFQNDEGDNDK